MSTPVTNVSATVDNIPVVQPLTTKIEVTHPHVKTHEDSISHINRKLHYLETAMARLINDKHHLRRLRKEVAEHSDSESDAYQSGEDSEYSGSSSEYSSSEPESENESEHSGTENSEAEYSGSEASDYEHPRQKKVGCPYAAQHHTQHHGKSHHSEEPSVVPHHKHHGHSSFDYQGPPREHHGQMHGTGHHGHPHHTGGHRYGRRGGRRLFLHHSQPSHHYGYGHRRYPPQHHYRHHPHPHHSQHGPVHHPHAETNVPPTNTNTQPNVILEPVPINPQGKVRRRSLYYN